jgi:antitoxin MazE
MHALKVSKWGNSLAIRLPADVVRQLNLHGGETLELEASGTTSLRLRKTLTREEAMDNLKRLTVHVADGWQIDRSAPDYRG